MGELLSILPHPDIVLLQYTGSNKSDWASSCSWYSFFSRYDIIRCLLVFYLELYIQTFDLHYGKKNSHLALKWSNCTLYKPGTELVCILSSVRLATFPSTLLWGISAHQVQTHNSPDPNNHGTKCWFRSCISFLHLLSFTVFAQVLKPERSPTPPRTPSPGSSCWCPVQTIHMR